VPLQPLRATPIFKADDIAIRAKSTNLIFRGGLGSMWDESRTLYTKAKGYPRTAVGDIVWSRAAGQGRSGTGR
jgi:hypothetical protein